MPITILITGSSQGLGKELALVLADKGRTIISHGRDKSSLDALKKQIEKRGAENIIVRGDLTAEKTIATLVSAAKKNNIDILINNAAQYLNCEFLNMKENEIHTMVEVNFISQVKLVRGILPHFLEKNKGLIININSLAGQKGSYGETLYSASKHALKGFSNSLKLEVLSKGIRITDVYLAAMATKMTFQRKDQDLLIKPEEAAKLISQLCTENESVYVSEIQLLRRKYG
ncbi:SDR family oxidoreductase [Candidatus Woesearchaeota archaeon]|nr:SDR family oxidoreductase [Candidatus Woesearchaeota archaeon]